jgi:hypothetical protein
LSAREGAQAVQGPEVARLAGAVFALLVLACGAAFILTQHLKHTPAAVQNFEMDTAFHPTAQPAARCRGRVESGQVNASERVEYLSFKPARAERVTVEIIDSAQASVATIVSDLPAERYKQLSLCWNGQLGATQSGGLAPVGEYRVRVLLRSQGLTRDSPRGFRLEAPR